jgi:hypothetical protein
MQITNDGVTDTLILVLRAGPAWISEEERSGITLDYDAEDCLIAIEILEASTRGCSPLRRVAMRRCIGHTLGRLSWRLRRFTSRSRD